MNRLPKALMLAAGLSAVLAWQAPAQAATPEETLYHWGECAVAAGAYLGLAENGSDNAAILKGAEAFKPVMPRVEKHANALAASLGEGNGDKVLEKLVGDYTPILETIMKQDDPAASVVKTLGPILDRCVAEAATLPTT